jgi:hypothetical protein
MKNMTAKKLLYALSVALVLLAACQKTDNAAKTNSTNSNTVTTNNYNISLSAAANDIDSVSIDVDNDKVNDFTIITYNSNYDSYKEPFTIQASYIHSLQDSTLIAVTNRYANYSGWFHIYNLGAASEFFLYAGGFSTGDVISAGVPDAETVEGDASTINAFEPVGNNTWDCTSSHVYENDLYSPFNQDVSIGDFLNTTQYIGFTMRKKDGRHYGWIKLSNSGSGLSIQVISSGYANGPGQSITAN